MDVFIPTYNEPEHVLRRTLIAAKNIEYPHKTWVLDDGNRQAIKDLAGELGCHYIAREENIDAKAGNINNALTQTEGEFILFLDADFIATPEFLDKTLGYFEDPKVAFVQTPQEYYNFESYQHIGRDRHHDAWSEHSLFFHAMQRGRDKYNAAMMCGSAAIMRRSALEEVGGFAATTVTEDMHTSTLLHANGWRSVYHPQILSAGLAPHDAKSFLQQRLRWAQGAMQVAKQEGLFASKSKLSFFQRLAYIMHVGNYAEGPRHTILYIASALTLLIYVSPIYVTFAEWAVFTIPFLMMAFITFEELGRGHGRLIKNEIYNMARCPALIRSFGVLFSKKQIAFKVTPKVKERSSVFLFPWIILIMNACALANAGHDYMNNDLDLKGWPLMIIAMWCILGVWLSANVCFLTRRCNLNRRSFSRFPVQIPVTLEGDGQNITATVTELSDQGLSFKLPSNLDTSNGKRYNGTFKLCGEDIEFSVLLRHDTKKGKTGGIFTKMETSALDRYRYLMMIDRIRTLENITQADHKTYIAPLAKFIARFQRKLNAA